MSVITAHHPLDVDPPIFDPVAFRLTDAQGALLNDLSQVARTRFAARATGYDREARFPVENYADLRDAGLMAACIPRDQGGMGARYQTYSLAGAEIGRYCGATALSWNMHVCSTLWSGPLADHLDMDEGAGAALPADRAGRRVLFAAFQ